MTCLTHGRRWIYRALLLGGALTQLAQGAASSGTVRMQERLQQWVREVGPRNPYDNSALVAALRERIPATRDPAARFRLEYQLAWELLSAGQTTESLAIVNRLAETMRPSTGAGLSTRRIVWQLQALASLRLGEAENCLQHHSPDSCLLPIAAAGRHVHPRGSEQAKRLFLRLAGRSSDLGSRWLLNIAAMTLGDYPNDVPAELRIPPQVFQSEHVLPRFPEVATQAGITMDALAGGAVAEDFDGDGLTDIFLTSWHIGDQCRYFNNLGNGRFADRTFEAGFEGVTGGLNAMQTDYNNDGWLDLYLTRGAWLGEEGRIPNSLLRNNGDGTFADVTEEAGLLAFHPSLAAVWFDANNDGWLDLWVGNETADAALPHPTQLFLNDGAGRFKDVALEAGAALRGFVRGVAAGDYDNDGWPDLYVSMLGATNVLLRNERQADSPRFTESTGLAGAPGPWLSFPTWFWDYDNDGWLDLLACGYGADLQAFSATSESHATLNEIVADKLGLPSQAAKPTLYRNLSQGRFEEVTRTARLDRALLVMGANFGDLDNDGYLDFYAGTGSPYFGSLLPNEMFRNSGGRHFENVTTSGGFGHAQKGHGIAFADLNNDGHQEVLLNVGGAFKGDNYFDALFANPGNEHRWLGLKLVGIRSNRAAIGARVQVVVQDSQGERRIHRSVGSGGSFGASSLRVEIGLGQAERIARIEVWWPASSTTNVLSGLDSNRFYEITEGKEGARLLAPSRFDWPELKQAAHPH